MMPPLFFPSPLLATETFLSSGVGLVGSWRLDTVLVPEFMGSCITVPAVIKWWPANQSTEFRINGRSQQTPTQGHRSAHRPPTWTWIPTTAISGPSRLIRSLASRCTCASHLWLAAAVVNRIQRCGGRVGGLLANLSRC